MSAPAASAPDLPDRRLDVGGEGVGHRLHRDRRIAADQDGSDADLAGLAAVRRRDRDERSLGETPLLCGLASGKRPKGA